MTDLRSFIATISAIGMPLLIAVLALGWYNWARFDSAFEFGIKYQLTNINYHQFQDSFSSEYFTGNLYNYFLHPFKVQSRFPYLIRIEFVFSNERLGGLIYMVPYILLVFMPFISGIRNLLSGKKDTNTLKAKNASEYWLILTLAGSAIISMITIMVFWFVTMRYIEDFMPSLLLLTTILIGREYRALEEQGIGRKILMVVATTFIIISIVASVLVALPANGLAFWVNLTSLILDLLNLK
jgi:hypothetical protein